MGIVLIYITIAVIGSVIGFIICSVFFLKEKCTHDWKLIQDGALHRFNKQGVAKEKIGFAKVYECTHCKQLKKELVLF